MADRAKKPRNYKRGRCLEFELICREEREAGKTVVVAEPCIAPFPCLVNIMVLAGLEQPCKHCEPNVQRMRGLQGWSRMPAVHGQFFMSDQIAPEQQQLIRHRIGQADMKNWEHHEAEEA